MVMIYTDEANFDKSNSYFEWDDNTSEGDEYIREIEVLNG